MSPPIKLVIDSSVIVKWINRTNEESLAQADKIMEDAQKGGVVLLTSELAKYEVGNVLLFGKNLTVPEARISLASLYALPLHFIPQTEQLSAETYNIAKATETTFYDAAFIALAKEEKATLVTDNPKHQKKVKGVKVIPLKDYRVLS